MTTQIPDSGAFSELVGSKFVIDAEPEPVEVTLDDVRCFDPQSGAPRQDPYALEFLVPKEWEFRQGMCVIRHERIGEVALFLTRISEELTQAIVN